MTKNKYPKVTVRWLDASRDMDWRTPESAIEEAEQDNLHIKTEDFLLLKETDRYVLLMANQTDGNGNILFTIQIPKVAILEIKRPPTRTRKAPEPTPTVT